MTARAWPERQQAGREPVVPDWMDLARCAEVDFSIFFPEKGESTAPAKFVCRGCEVRAECLEYALERQIWFGVWGGMSVRQRERLTGKRGAA